MSKISNQIKTYQSKTISLEEGLHQLESLNIIKEAKEKIKSYIIQERLNKKRSEAGLERIKLTKKFIFLDESDEKLNTAILIGQILNSIGSLLTTDLRYINARDFLGENIGKLEANVLENYDFFKDGILYIDNIESLINDTLGIKVIDKLAQLIHDKNDIYFIVSGDIKFKQFLENNFILHNAFGRNFVWFKHEL